MVFYLPYDNPYKSYKSYDIQSNINSTLEYQYYYNDFIMKIKLKNYIIIEDYLKKEDFILNQDQIKSSLDAALSRYDIDMLKLLLNNERFKNSNIEEMLITALHKSPSRPALNVIKFILTLNPDLSYENSLPLIRACSYGNLYAVIEFMKDERIDPSARNNMALKEVTRKGNSSIILELIKDKRVDPSILDNMIIKRYQNNITLTKLLLRDYRVLNTLDNFTKNKLIERKFLPSYEPKKYLNDR
jgi:hypothetical protein